MGNVGRLTTFVKLLSKINTWTKVGLSGFVNRFDAFAQEMSNDLKILSMA